MMCLLLASLGINAQKSYVTMLRSQSFDGGTSYVSLSGDVPSSMNKYYNTSETSIGEVLNMLSSCGYEVEFMCNQPISNRQYTAGTFFLLSKPTSTPENITRMASATNEEIKEVARYNLQGIPVNENTKGIQIIVYSNYTTKTVVVE